MNLNKYCYLICLISFGTSITLSGQPNQFSKLSDSKQNNYFLKKLENLSHRYDVEFAYEHDLLSEKIEKECPEDFNLDDCLGYIFSASGVEYELREKKVLLRNRSYAEDQVEISGYISDKDSGEPLPYVLIDDGLNHAFFSDSMGYFKRSYPKAIVPDSLQFSYLGYTSTKNSISSIADHLKIRMLPRINLIPVIKITDVFSKNGSRRISELDPMKTNGFPSGLTGNDILRNIQLQPGIAAHNDLSAEIKIRGSEAYETMIDLDGIVLYNPTHFYNFFSAVNSEYVEHVELYQNNMPIEYSGRTGGLVKMESKQLNKPRFRFNTSADLLNAAALIELPIEKNTGLLLSARTSYTDILRNNILRTISGNAISDIDPLKNNNLVEQLSPDFQYYDINAKFQTLLGTNQILDINFYSSRDKLNNALKKELGPFEKIENYIFDYNEDSNWRNMGFSSNYNFNFSPNHKSAITLSYSRSDFDEDFSFYNYIEAKNFDRELNYNNLMKNEIRDFHLNWKNTWLIGNQFSLRYGIEAGEYQSDTRISSDEKTIKNLASKEQSLAVFQELKGYFGDWQLSFGSRFNYLVQNQKFLADPRLSLSYKLSENRGDLYGSFGLNHQFLYQFTYENHLGQSYAFWTIADENIPVMNSYNTTLGYSYKNERFKFMIEAYHKNRNNITEIALLKPGLQNEMDPGNPDEFKIFTGQGNILGIDLIIAKKINKITSQLNYTLSSNLVQFDEIFKGNPFPSQDDRRHQLKWLNSLNLNHFAFSMNTIYTSGRPYFDVSNLNKDKNRKDLKLNDQIKFIPPYFRIDLGIEYDRQVLGKKFKIGLSVVNLTNRLNLYNIQYIRPVQIKGQNSGLSPVGTQSSLLGRTLNLSLALKF